MPNLPKFISFKITGYTVFRDVLLIDWLINWLIVVVIIRRCLWDVVYAFQDIIQMFNEILHLIILKMLQIDVS